MNKTSVLVGVLGALILAGIGYFYFIVPSAEKSVPADRQAANGRQQEESPADEPLAGSDADEHGCIGSAGYAWCEGKSKCLRFFEEFCPDEAGKLAVEIKADTGIELASKGSTTFNWIVNYADEKTAGQDVDGVRYEAQGVSLEDVKKIEDYLNSIAEPDSFNLADGPEGGLRGYYYNYMACDLDFRRVGGRETPEGIAEPSGGNLDVALSCGYFNRNDLPKISVREAMRELFVKKYNLAPASMNITVVSLAESHVRGSVAFLDESGNPASGGYFFAKQAGDNWELVLDGNGQISCSLLRDSGFPEEMMSDCSQDQE